MDKLRGQIAIGTATFLLGVTLATAGATAYIHANFVTYREFLQLKGMVEEIYRGMFGRPYSSLPSDSTGPYAPRIHGKIQECTGWSESVLPGFGQRRYYPCT